MKSSKLRVETGERVTTVSTLERHFPPPRRIRTAFICSFPTARVHSVLMVLSFSKTMTVYFAVERWTSVFSFCSQTVTLARRESLSVIILQHTFTLFALSRSAQIREGVSMCLCMTGWKKKALSEYPAPDLDAPLIPIKKRAVWTDFSHHYLHRDLLALVNGVDWG